MQRIVVVEDDPWIRGVLRDVFTDEGYRVCDAGDGRTGLRLIRAKLPDLVVLDLAMPEISGMHVLQQLRLDRRTRSVPVVVITAFAAVLPSQNDTTVSGILRKPLDLDQLLAHVRQALEPAV